MKHASEGLDGGDWRAVPCGADFSGIENARSTSNPLNPKLAPATSLHQFPQPSNGLALNGLGARQLLPSTGNATMDSLDDFEKSLAAEKAERDRAAQEKEERRARKHKHHHRRDRSSERDRATRSRPLTKHQVDHTRAKQDSASSAAGPRGPSARSGIGANAPGRCRILPHRTRPEHRGPHANRASGRPDPAMQDRASGATGPLGPARAQLAPLPCGGGFSRRKIELFEGMAKCPLSPVLSDVTSIICAVGEGTGPACVPLRYRRGGVRPRDHVERGKPGRSPIGRRLGTFSRRQGVLGTGTGRLLGRAGEAPSGSCREVKRRHTQSTTSQNHRRLTSRKVPDCLRCPAEERTHPRNTTTPNPNPPTEPHHPHRPRHSPREGPAPEARS